MQNMTPSTTVANQMTDGQIDKAVGNYRAMLCKHRTDLGSEAVQQVLGSTEFATAQFALLRSHVEAVSNMIVRRVRVDRSRNPQQVLDATGRKQHINDSAVASMPRGEGDEVDVYFLKLDRNTSCANQEKELALRGLVSDPYAQSAVNEADPAFADDHPNGSQWKDENGNYTYVTFYRWHGERYVLCRRRGYDWFDCWWFAGVRK